jgi:hypothetical protein
MPNTIAFYCELAIGLATMIAVSVVAGLATGAMSGNRAVVIGACVVGLAASGIVLAFRLWRIARSLESTSGLELEEARSEQANW